MNNNINWLGNKVDGKDSPYLVSDSLMNKLTKEKENSDSTIPVINGTATQSPTYGWPITPGTQQRQQTLQPQTPPRQQPPMQQTPPMQQQTPLMPVTLQGPPPAAEVGYIPYFLTLNIGRYVRAEFIIGNDQYSDKTGRILEVGVNYFVLDDINSRTQVMCDLYSVKFVTLLPEGEFSPIS